MATKRTWRERQGVEFLSAYQASELLTGEINYPVMGYDGYGDGVGKDLVGATPPSSTTAWVGLGARKISGCALKRSTHRALQKKYFFPLYSDEPAAFSGWTCMPHTGSNSVFARGSSEPAMVSRSAICSCLFLDSTILDGCTIHSESCPPRGSDARMAGAEETR